MSVHQMVRDYLDWAKAYPPGSDARLDDLMRRSLATTVVGGAVRGGGPMFSCIDATGVGLMVYVRQEHDQMMVLPGHLPLLVYGGDVAVLNLDLAFEIGDAAVRGLRAIVVDTLTERSIDFLPLSMNALRGGLMLNSIEALASAFVARDGLQCVFTVNGAHYISGFDANEDPPLYFLARLPHPVDSYTEAIESLKPGSVKEAEAQGLQVLRQGDMFAIPTDFTTDKLKFMGAAFSMEVTRELPTSPFLTWRDINMWFPGHPTTEVLVEAAPPTVTYRRGLYGTAHTATELAYLPEDGTMFARGVVEHDPRGVLGQPRQPDHKPLNLPLRQWFLMVRNTVPTTSHGRG
jgi:hypothetical protein